MSKLPWTLGVAFALALGCRVGPDYARPTDTPVPESFRGQAFLDASERPGPEQLQSFGDLTWSGAFGDPVLRELIEVALRDNYDLGIVAERVLQARSRVTIAGAGALPDINAGVGFQSAKISENGTNGIPAFLDPRADEWSLSADLSWEFDFWGLYARATEAARADLLATSYAQRAVVQSLVIELTQAYFDLLLLDEQLEITQDTLESRERSLELVTLRLDQGVANKVEFYQAESLVLQTAGTLPALEQGIVQQENVIRFLIGTGPGPVARGTSLMEQQLEISIPVGLPSDLLERRPDIGQAEQGLVAANARIGEAKALLYPSIGLTAFGGLASADLSDLTSSGSDVWGISPTVRLPIFNAGRLRSNVEVTESQQREAALNYSKVLQNAFREVSDALVGREKRGEVRIWRERTEAALRGQVELSRDRYRGGVTSYLEVLDSERGHFDAEINLAISVRDELVAYVLLYRALGGGWQLAEDLETPPSEG